MKIASVLCFLGGVLSSQAGDDLIQFELDDEILLQLALQESAEAFEANQRVSPTIELYSKFCLDPYKSAHIWEVMSGTPEASALAHKFVDISSHLEVIRNDTDVHQLDAYIFGPSGIMPDLLKLGQLLQFDQDNLSWAEIKAKLFSFYPESNGEFITEYIGEKVENGHVVEDRHVIGRTSLFAQINTYFDSLPQELATTFKENQPRIDEFRQLWSRTLTLTESFKMAGDVHCLPLLAQCIAENYITNGGCLQGRINRVVIRYVSLLGATGLRSIVEIL